MTAESLYRVDLVDGEGRTLGSRVFVAPVDGDQVSVVVTRAGTISWVELSVPNSVRRERMTGLPMGVAPCDTVTVHIDPAALATPAPTPEAIGFAVAELAAMAAELARSESPAPAPIPG